MTPTTTTQPAQTTQTFDAVLVRPAGVGTWTYLPIPFDVASVFGGKGQVKVRGSINGPRIAAWRCPEATARTIWW